MMSGRLNTATAATSDDFPFAAMQPPPYVGFDPGMAAVAGAGHRPGGMQQPLYDNIDFAAAAAAAATLQFQEPHQLLTLPPNGLPMAPPPMPMPLQMPMPMHGMQGDVYPALGIVKREGGCGGGPDVGGETGRIGLNLGRRTYFSPGDMLAVDRLLMRSRLGGVFGLGFGGAQHQPPRCQTEGCKADLSGAKHYHRRHKVCEYHAKAAVVVAGGKQQRFCQQCSRFHVLTEFDEAKRSCRKRLAEHNRRRRKPATSTVVDKDSAAQSKKPNPTSAITSSYTTDNGTLSATKSTISSNTSVISCLNQSKAARPTLTLGAPQEKDQLSTMLHVQAGHHHQEQHFITPLVQNNNNPSSSNNNNTILSCSSVCSSALPSANGELSDQNNNTSNNMHLFEVDFM